MNEAQTTQWADRVLQEIGAVFAAFADENADRMCTEILNANRICCYGAGREGLMVRALCMRLMHLGFDAHMVGDVTTPPVGAGDLLLVSSGPGDLSTVRALMETAAGAGARTLVVTAQPQARDPQRADVVVHLPAQTMASDMGDDASVLPMGSLFEIAQLIFFDLIARRLQAETGQSMAQIRARHTNLE